MRSISHIAAFPALLACFFAAWGIGTTAAQTQSPWVSRTSASTQSLSSVAFGAGLYVAVGDGGAIVTSPDAVAWSPRTSGTTAPLRGICFGAGQFVAVGGSGTILSSPDGITWTVRTSPTTLFLSGVAHGAGKFVAVGAFGVALTSPDGIAWASVDSTADGKFLQGIIYAGDLFLAFGQEAVMIDGELHGTLRSSADGLEWETVTMPISSDVYAATYFRGRYYTGGIYGECFSSADLLLWRQEDLGTFFSIRAMATDGHTLVATSESGNIHSSKDGATWTSRASGVPATLFGAAYANGIFVMAGAVNVGSGTILTSLQDPIVSAYDAWKSLKFTEIEQADPEISGPGADFDRDGIPNLAEFAHALAPKSPDYGTDRLLSMQFGAPYTSVSLTWTYDNIAAEYVTIRIRYSDTLAPGSWMTLPNPIEILGSDGDLRNALTVDSGPLEGTRFYRLEYTLVE
ncbi:hypothetical protein HZ994_06580 [Akkermansiaceae bacterium]|nr:hypothetical protein HZ994_06580 [Akkermansiaceae bacterium]